MRFRFDTHEPPHALRRLVRSSFFARGRIGYRTDKIIPTGLVALLFTAGNAHRVGKSPDPARNPGFAHSWIEGLQTTPNYHTPLDGTHVLGILFEPPGFHALFDVDMARLRDRIVDARTVLPGDFIALVESRLPRASAPASHQAIFRALLARRQAAVDEWLWRFYAAVVSQRGDIRIGEWYAKSAHGPRHAARQFKRAVGVTPKVLARVHRLLALLEKVDPQRPGDWTGLAHAFGFFDQAHFNHEFRKLTGQSPGDYLTQRRRDLPGLRPGESPAFVPQR